MFTCSPTVGLEIDPSTRRTIVRIVLGIAAAVIMIVGVLFYTILFGGFGGREEGNAEQLANIGANGFIICSAITLILVLVLAIDASITGTEGVP